MSRPCWSFGSLQKKLKGGVHPPLLSYLQSTRPCVHLVSVERRSERLFSLRTLRGGWCQMNVSIVKEGTYGLQLGCCLTSPLSAHCIVTCRRSECPTAAPVNQSTVDLTLQKHTALQQVIGCHSPYLSLPNSGRKLSCQLTEFSPHARALGPSSEKSGRFADGMRAMQSQFARTVPPRIPPEMLF